MAIIRYPDGTTLDVKNGNGVYTGTSNNDIIKVSDSLRSAVVKGLDGHDTITGGVNASNTLHGGDGNDKIYGGNYHDVIYGDSGSDEIYGDLGSDIIYTGSGKDTIFYNSANDSTVAKFDTIKDFSGENDDIILTYFKMMHQVEYIAFEGQLIVNIDSNNNGSLNDASDFYLVINDTSIILKDFSITSYITDNIIVS